MRTALECLPCFLMQTLHTVRLSTSDPSLQFEVMAQVSRLLSRIDLDLSPPENSIAVYNLIAEISGCADPFADIKEKSNAFAMRLVPELRKKIQASEDPLLTAVKFAIAGNIIDYGSQQKFDAQKAVDNCIESKLSIDDYSIFREDLAEAETILYLGDNCGEIIFDALLAQLISESGKSVIFAVKDRPIINDAVIEDALSCGLGEYCEVISNGTNCPGTPLESCSPAFQKVFRNADLIISKGQGNFETLSENQGPIYYMLTVKCPVVASHIAGHACRTKNVAEFVKGNGELVLYKNNLFTSSS